MIKSKLNPDFSNQVKDAYIRGPGGREIGYLGHGENKVTGKPDSVQIKFDPNDQQIKDNFITHTHPIPSDRDPTPLDAMPSETDLVSAIMISREHGMKGSNIICGDFYTILVPTTRATKSHFPAYVNALKRGDIEDALVELKKAGFEVETGTRP